MHRHQFNVLLNLEGSLKTHTFSDIEHKFGLYLIQTDGEIIRVGETGTHYMRLVNGFRQPLRHTLRGRERKNYLAYSWRTEYAGQELAIDYFVLLNSRFAASSFRRALEAEVTFQLRLHYGQWPRRMCEIHFNESFRCDPLLVETASGILKHYGITYDTKT